MKKNLFFSKGARIFFAGLAAFYLLAIAGCNVLKRQVGVDRGLDLIEEAIDKLEEQSIDWRETLEATRDSLIAAGQSTLAHEVSDILSRAVSDVGIELRCDIDFLRDRVKEDLKRLRATLTKETVKLVPVFCQATPKVIDMHVAPERRTHIEISGYNLDVASVQVFLENNQNQRINVSNALASPTRYLITLNLGSSGVPLDLHSSKIIFELGGGETRSVNIIQAPPPPPVIKVVALNFTYWTGDEDKDNDGGHVGAEVIYKGQVVADGTTQAPNDPNTVWRDETTHGPYRLQLNVPFPADDVRHATVAIWHRRDGGSPAWRFRVEIDAILDNGEKRRVLNEYDPERFFNHKPGDKKWWVFDLRGRKGEKLKTPHFPLKN